MKKKEMIIRWKRVMLSQQQEGRKKREREVVSDLKNVNEGMYTLIGSRVWTLPITGL
jgi:hypothetical protein